MSLTPRDHQQIVKSRIANSYQGTDKKKETKDKETIPEEGDKLDDKAMTTTNTPGKETVVDEKGKIVKSELPYYPGAENAIHREITKSRIASVYGDGDATQKASDIDLGKEQPKIQKGISDITPFEHDQINKSRIANTIGGPTLNEDQLEQVASNELEKGKKAAAGETRMFGGKKYIKTVDGWKLVGKTGGKVKEAHDTIHEKKSKDATDSFIEHEGKHYVDTLDADSGEKKFKVGDKVHYKDEAGKDHKGKVGKDKHPTEDNVHAIEPEEKEKTIFKNKQDAEDKFFKIKDEVMKERGADDDDYDDQEDEIMGEANERFKKEHGYDHYLDAVDATDNDEGQTGGGKTVSHTKNAGDPMYEDFTSEDHKEASKHLKSEYNKQSKIALDQKQGSDAQKKAAQKQLSLADLSIGHDVMAESKGKNESDKKRLKKSEEVSAALGELGIADFEGL